MLKNLLDACGASIAYFAIGYALSFGGDDSNSSEKTFIGTSGFFLQNVDDEKLALWTFQFAFAATATTIVAGALAERCQMIAYLSYSFLLVGFVYPVIVHAFWSSHGYLSGRTIEPLFGVGTLDFSGSGVVHLTGGYVALISTKILGPRKGRFHDDSGRELEKPNKIPGHSIALQMLGCMLLWVGWFGFNIGAVLTLDTPDGPKLASLVAVNTALSAGMGGLAALFVNLFIVERQTGEAQFDLHFVMNGTLSGAVAITGGCSLVEPWAAVIIGFIAGVCFILGHHLVLRLRVDDCVDAIAGKIISQSLNFEISSFHLIYLFLINFFPLFSAYG
jgi:ammonium transporter, Amt family